jgi:HK97 family phage prohead protease
MELANRAYAAFEVKAIGDGRRTFKGWATTPAVDRVGDTIDPLGVRFKNPLALLHQHRSDMPIGTAVFGKPTAKGIEFDAEIPVVEEPLALKERLDVAWGEIKSGLVRAVSIGFRPIKYAFKDDGGVDYQEIEVYELSSVTIPALPEAVITSVKSMSPLTHESISAIKRFDNAIRMGSVPLLQAKKILGLSGGAVSLNRAT